MTKTKITTAVVGQTIDLVTSVANGDGKTVHYRLLVVETGDALDELDAPVEAGVARTQWTVALGDRPLPAQIKFLASVDGGKHVESPPIQVDPPGMLGLAAWVVDPGKRGGQPGVLEPTDDDPFDPSQPPSNQPFAPGDSVVLRVDVADDHGKPLAGNFVVVYQLQKEQTENHDDYKTVKELRRDVSGPTDRVLARWTADTMGLPPPHRFRFLCRWERRPGEQQTTPDTIASSETR
jgi:hypothetical protein